jgi:hypothetical protein
MANIFKIKRSNVSNAIPLLENGEIAINQKDKKLFFTDDLGAVQSFSLDSNLLINANKLTNLIKQVVVNFTTPSNYATFTINDADCKATSFILVNQDMLDDGNENCGDDMDQILITAGNSSTGSFIIGVKHADDLHNKLKKTI